MHSGKVTNQSVKDNFSDKLNQFVVSAAQNYFSNGLNDLLNR